jgi:hypothetical protein
VPKKTLVRFCGDALIADSKMRHPQYRSRTFDPCFPPTPDFVLPRAIHREQTTSTAGWSKHIALEQASHPVLLLSQSWTLLRSAVNGFLDDEALTRGGAIAFYTATSFAPVLLIVIAIAGLVYGQEAAQGPSRSSATGSIDNSPGGIFLHR